MKGFWKISLSIIILVIASTMLVACNGSHNISITVASDNVAMGSVYGTGEYIKGTNVTIAAVPEEGYDFYKWEPGNIKTAVTTIAVDESTTYTAYFTPKVAATTVTINVAGGSGSGTYEVGSTVTIKPAVVTYFTYFANTTNNTVFAWQYQVDINHGYSFVATKNLSIKAVHLENLIGYGATWFSAMPNPYANLWEARPLNPNVISNLSYFYKNNPSSTTYNSSTITAVGALISPTYNTGGNTVKYTLQVPAAYDYVQLFVIVWIPEIGDNVAMIWGVPNAFTAMLTISVQNTQTNEVFALGMSR